MNPCTIYCMDLTINIDRFARTPVAGQIAAAIGAAIHDGRLWHRVARAEVTGEASRRRVAYLPFVEGPYKPKTEDSPTPIYHYLQRITG